MYKSNHHFSYIEQAYRFHIVCEYKKLKMLIAVFRNQSIFSLFIKMEILLIYISMKPTFLTTVWSHMIMQNVLC